VISVFNPEGYDDRQVLHIQQLQINAAYSVMRQNDKSGDAWISQGPSLFSTASEPAGQLQMNKLSDIPPHIDTALGEDMGEEKEEIDNFDARRINNKLITDRGPAELTLIMQEIEYVLRSYNLTLTDRNKEMPVSGCTTTVTQVDLPTDSIPMRPSLSSSTGYSNMTLYVAYLFSVPTSRMRLLRLCVSSTASAKNVSTPTSRSRYPTTPNQPPTSTEPSTLSSLRHSQ
jgi:hypothetical protein